MHPKEPLHIRFERESAERQGLVDLAYSISSAPSAGMKRLMWFGDSDTPMPVDVPESLASQIKAISAKAGLDQGPIGDLPTPKQWQAMSKMRRLVQPYIDAQYPTLPRAGTVRNLRSWWMRVLGKFEL